jgi:hypothetical protein
MPREAAFCTGTGTGTGPGAPEGVALKACLLGLARELTDCVRALPFALMPCALATRKHSVRATDDSLRSGFWALVLQGLRPPCNLATGIPLAGGLCIPVDRTLGWQMRFL